MLLDLHASGRLDYSHDLFVSLIEALMAALLALVYLRPILTIYS